MPNAAGPDDYIEALLLSDEHPVFFVHRSRTAGELTELLSLDDVDSLGSSGQQLEAQFWQNVERRDPRVRIIKSVIFPSEDKVGEIYGRISDDDIRNELIAMDVLSPSWETCAS